MNLRTTVLTPHNNMAQTVAFILTKKVLPHASRTIATTHSREKKPPSPTTLTTTLNSHSAVTTPLSNRRALTTTINSRTTLTTINNHKEPIPTLRNTSHYNNQQTTYPQQSQQPKKKFPTKCAKGISAFRRGEELAL